MARLPEVGGDSGSWGQLLNDYLGVAHNADGTLKDSTVTGAKLANNAVTVAKIATSGTPDDGQALTYTGGALSWTTLAGGGAVPDATTSSKGLIQLAGHLGGTASSPTVPGLALKANTADLATVATSGSYVDLTNKPTIPIISDANGSTKGIVQLAGDLSGTAASPTVPGLASKANTADLATVATSGSYTDLTNKPTIPTVPVTSVAGRTGAITLTSADVGLGNVNNTSDANKPISSATQTALDAKAATVHTHAASAITSGTLSSSVLPLATDLVPGAIELATVAEAQAGTDTSRAVTPEGLKTVVDALPQPKVIFVDTLGDIPNGTPVDTLVVVRAA